MAVYVDPTSGEWVAEYETRDVDGEVTRQTEWFKSKADALRFSRTGPMPDSDEEHERNCKGCSYCDPHPGSSPRP